MEDAVVAAIGLAGSFIYAFGARFGPEKQKDQYFKFTPENGMHDIHMNQGNDKGHAGDDGVYQDGCLIFQYPDGKYRAFFMAFQSQSFHTDNKTGHTIPGRKAAKAIKKKSSKKKELACGPGHSVGLLAGVEVTGDFERLQIDDGDVIVGRAGHVDNGTVRLHLDAGRAASHFHPFHHGAGGGVEDRDVGTTKVETKTRLPSGVNFRRLAPVTSAARV